MGTDLLALLEPSFEHFLRLPERWVVETNIPWARYHNAIIRLSKRIQVVHEGCGAARWRLAIGASGGIFPCICACQPAMRMGSVRCDDLATVFRESRIAKMMRHPERYGICSDCRHVTTCGAGCRAAAFARAQRIDAVDEFCPIWRAIPAREDRL